MLPALFNDVTLLITHYNRSCSVKRLLETLQNQNIRFAATIIADDGSQRQHVQRLQSLAPVYGFQLVTSEQNYGLGHNLNKGQAHVQTALTLYVQEDFLPTAKFSKALLDSVEFMRTDEQIDLVRFFSNFQYPYTKPYKHDFSYLYIPPFALDYQKIYLYSDNPHLRRSNFLDKFGRYREDLPGDRTEYRMCISFIQKHGKALLHNDFHGIFKHINTTEEPSTMTRVAWRQHSSPLLSLARDIYRQLKYNYDITFSKR
ncbi:MAG: glycosyltransferase family 2 protein [Janthinobacterium lividum]